MAAILRVQGEGTLPPGPRRWFALDVYDLYKKAGRPTLDAIVAIVAELQDDLRGTVSKETARRILTGKNVPRHWETAEALIEALAHLAEVELDWGSGLSLGSSREQLRERWDRALDTLPDHEERREYYAPRWMTTTGLKALKAAEERQERSGIWEPSSPF